PFFTHPSGLRSCPALAAGRGCKASHARCGSCILVRMMLASFMRLCAAVPGARALAMTLALPGIALLGAAGTAHVAQSTQGAPPPAPRADTPAPRTDANSAQAHAELLARSEEHTSE